MSRLVILGVVGVALIAIAVTVWLRLEQAAPTTGKAGAPHQYDTTGGQEMRPRWNNNSGGQADGDSGN